MDSSLELQRHAPLLCLLPFSERPEEKSMLLVRCPLIGLVSQRPLARIPGVSFSQLQVVLMQYLASGFPLLKPLSDPAGPHSGSPSGRSRGGPAFEGPPKPCHQGPRLVDESNPPSCFLSQSTLDP